MQCLEKNLSKVSTKLGCSEMTYYQNLRCATLFRRVIIVLKIVSNNKLKSKFKKRNNILEKNTIVRSII